MPIVTLFEIRVLSEDEQIRSVKGSKSEFDGIKDLDQPRLIFHSGVLHQKGDHDIFSPLVNLACGFGFADYKELASYALINYLPPESIQIAPEAMHFLQKECGISVSQLLGKYSGITTTEAQSSLPEHSFSIGLDDVPEFFARCQSFYDTPNTNADIEAFFRDIDDALASCDMSAKP